MKKLLIFLFLLLLTGCLKIDNSPKTEVQRLFSDYKSLSSDVLIQLDETMENENLTVEQKLKYKDILKKQYEDLDYKIKDEIISEDDAVVSVEIDVYNLKSVINSTNDYLNNNQSEFLTDKEFDNNKFWDYRLNEMSKTNERINYIIDFTLTKVDNKWELDNLLESDRQKIHGLY